MAQNKTRTEVALDEMRRLTIVMKTGAFSISAVHDKHMQDHGDEKRAAHYAQLHKEEVEKQMQPLVDTVRADFLEPVREFKAAARAAGFELQDRMPGNDFDNTGLYNTEEIADMRSQNNVL